MNEYALDLLKRHVHCCRETNPQPESHIVGFGREVVDFDLVETNCVYLWCLEQQNFEIIMSTVNFTYLFT